MKNRSTDILSNLSATIINRTTPQHPAAEATARYGLAHPQATAPQPPSPQKSIPHHPTISPKYQTDPRAYPPPTHSHPRSPANSSAYPTQQTSPHSICWPLTNSLKTANLFKWAVFGWRNGSFSSGREEVGGRVVKVGKKEGREGKESRSEDLKGDL